VDPLRRPVAEELLRHSFFAQLAVPPALPARVIPAVAPASKPVVPVAKVRDASAADRDRERPPRDPGPAALGRGHARDRTRERRARRAAAQRAPAQGLCDAGVSQGSTETVGAADGTVVRRVAVVLQ
jgi:hypothetical protein